MKRLFLTALILAMLTPSLACAGMLCCPQDSKPAPAQEKPCHSHEQKKQQDIKFMKDCGLIDLQAAPDHSFVKKQVSQSHDLFLPFVETGAALLRKTDIHSIRAPPRDPGSPHNLPVYLSTQRLRI